MAQRFYTIYIIFLAVMLAGCGSVMTKSIVAKQGWSENYATAKGVSATSPLMVDGDPATLAETQTPADVGSPGATKFTEAVVKLPEKKSIRRIVVRSPNLRSFSVYAAGENEGEWKLLEEVKNSKENKVVMNVSAVTDKIKIRVLKTSDDVTQPGGRGSQPQLKRAPGKIQEIEIYGLVEEQAKTTPTGTGATTSTEPSSAPVEVPKGPPITASLETPQNSYPITGPVPLKMNLKIGPDALIVLADHVSDEMLRTKLLVKSPTGETIACSKPTPPLSKPRPFRADEGPIDVRLAKTLEPNSVITVDFANLLDYYPIKVQGRYTVQLDMLLEVHEKFVGREQTEKEDLERRIRDINSRTNYTPAEKAALIQELKEEIAQSEKRKAPRYIPVGARGKPLELKSNVLELTIHDF